MDQVKEMVQEWLKARQEREDREMRAEQVRIEREQNGHGQCDNYWMH